MLSTAAISEMRRESARVILQGMHDFNFTHPPK